MQTSDVIKAIAFHPILPHVASVGNNPMARVYDLVSKRYIAFIPLPGLGSHVCFSHDGRFLATATFDPDWTEGEDQESPSPYQVCLWNASDGYRLVKSDGYAIPWMTRKVMKEMNLTDPKDPDVKIELGYIKNKYYKLHTKRIISLQFVRPTVEIIKEVYEEAPEKKIYGRVLRKKRLQADAKYGGDEKKYDKKAPLKKKLVQKKIYRQVEVLFSASEDDLLRFWEFNPRFDDDRRTIPCEFFKNYDQGLRYIASLRHIDMIRDHEGTMKRHQNYIAARVSPDGRLLCTLDSNSRTACLVKLAYEKMIVRDEFKVEEVAHIPRDSERTISFPLILHQFSPNIQMLCLDFVRDPNPPTPQQTAGNTNSLAGPYHVIFGGKDARGKQEGMIELITLDMASKNNGGMESVLKADCRPDEQELSPFILESTGVLSGSVKKLKLKMSKRIQISNNQETITKVTHATKVKGTINVVDVSSDGAHISTGDMYVDGDDINYVISWWTPIPNGFSRKTIGNQTGQIRRLCHPEPECQNKILEFEKMDPKTRLVLSSGDATIHMWKYLTSDTKLVGRVASTPKPLVTLEHQITGQQRQVQEKIVSEVQKLNHEMKEADDLQHIDVIQRQRDTHEKEMKAEVEQIMLADPGTSITQTDKAIKLQEQMQQLTDAEDQMLIMALNSAQKKETGLESYARFTAGTQDEEETEEFDEPNPVLKELVLPEKRQTEKRDECVICSIQ